MHILIATCSIVGAILYFTATPQVVDRSVSGKVTSASTSKKSSAQCLAENIYYEAGVESTSGKYAVAQVTMNRLKSGRWGNSVCSVVYSYKQFSWTLNAGREQPSGAAWRESQKIAKQVLAGKQVNGLTTALYYHAGYVSPVWKKKSAKIAKIGQHIFYSAAKIQNTPKGA
ncbi:SleB Cell wall hydrolyses involved in spore germination [uncultured Caudovirales phage]|uniref:SleB Cell wall hydrolyses involved in spore germination n=1 Tax=uncultured Caudovirales phage TaxID=2100421 RepID=A0A6J5L8Z1_9CAUD|nr:SleB Cell wall hydrolyses involved in spore germination [uncultured Caudovirales phage]